MKSFNEGGDLPKCVEGFPNKCPHAGTEAEEADICGNMIATKTGQVNWLSTELVLATPPFGVSVSLGQSVASPALTDEARRSGRIGRIPPKGGNMVSRRRTQNAVLVTALACILSLASLARASSCNKDVVAPIQMAAGQVCWAYRGAATTFVGSFSSGQAITAQMIGEASEYDPRSGRVATVWRPRDPNLEGPGGFVFGAAQAPGELTFVAPANGPYRFNFWPCAMWAARGAVKTWAH